MSIKIALVDDHEMIREGIKKILENHAEVEIVHDFSKGGYLLNMNNDPKIDVVLLDLQLPDRNGEELVPLLKSKLPDLRIIILTTNENTYTVKKMISMGVDGYIFKNAGRTILLEGIMHVMNESTPFLPAEIKENIKRKTNPEDKNISLTPRELDILRLIEKEFTSMEIGAILQINHRTVDIYRQGIMQKLGTKNMVGMVKKAIMLGLIKE